MKKASQGNEKERQTQQKQKKGVEGQINKNANHVQSVSDSMEASSLGKSEPKANCCFKTQVTITQPPNRKQKTTICISLFHYRHKLFNTHEALYRPTPPR